MAGHEVSWKTREARLAVFDAVMAWAESEWRAYEITTDPAERKVLLSRAQALLTDSDVEQALTLKQILGRLASERLPGQPIHDSAFAGGMWALTAGILDRWLNAPDQQLVSPEELNRAIKFVSDNAKSIGDKGQAAMEQKIAAYKKEREDKAEGAS